VRCGHKADQAGTPAKDSKARPTPVAVVANAAAERAVPKGDCRADYAPKPDLDPSPMCKIAGGTFMMGAPADDMDAAPNQRPVRKVKLSPYYLDELEVTNAQVAAYIASGAKNCAASRASRRWIRTSRPLPSTRMENTSARVAERRGGVERPGPVLPVAGDLGAVGGQCEIDRARNIARFPAGQDDRGVLGEGATVDDICDPHECSAVGAEIQAGYPVKERVVRALSWRGQSMLEGSPGDSCVGGHCAVDHGCIGRQVPAVAVAPERCEECHRKNGQHGESK